MFSFTAILSRRRTSHLDAQWQLRTGFTFESAKVIQYIIGSVESAKLPGQPVS